MKIQDYLNRIEYKAIPRVNIETLKNLHYNHVMKVPFENIDIQMDKSLSLEKEELFEKVVKKKRGGFCYELNYLFYLLLKNIGFDAHLISVRIYKDENIGPEFDHLAILVKLEDHYLVDVGYGDLFLNPLKVISNMKKQVNKSGYWIEKEKNDSFQLFSEKNGSLNPIYRFTIIPREIHAFQPMLIWKESHPSSKFVRNLIVTLPLVNGRRTIINREYKVRELNNVKIQRIDSYSTLNKVLVTDFDINLKEIHMEKWNQLP